MNIVIGLVSLAPGGTEYQLHLLANALINNGHNVTIYLTDTSPLTTMATPRYSIRFMSHNTLHKLIPYCKTTHIPSIIQLIREWRVWLKQDKPDVIIAGLILPHYIFTFATLGLNIPIIARRGFDWAEILHLPNYLAAFNSMRKVRFWTMLRTKHLICNAYHVQKSAIDIEGWNPSKVSIIRNGWPEYHPIPYTSIRAIYSGRDRVEKEFTIPGVERVTSIPVWSNVGIYVHPTRAEGCSNSIGMAMSHGIPVIAYQTAGNEELLGNEYPALVSDMPTLRWWLSTLEASTFTRVYLGNMCHNRVRANYSLKAMVDSWEGVLRDEARECSTHKDVVPDSVVVRHQY